MGQAVGIFERGRLNDLLGNITIMDGFDNSNGASLDNRLRTGQLIARIPYTLPPCTIGGPRSREDYVVPGY